MFLLRRLFYNQIISKYTQKLGTNPHLKPWVYVCAVVVCLFSLSHEAISAADWAPDWATDGAAKWATDSLYDLGGWGGLDDSLPRPPSMQFNTLTGEGGFGDEFPPNNPPSGTRIGEPQKPMSNKKYGDLFISKLSRKRKENKTKEKPEYKRSRKEIKEELEEKLRQELRGELEALPKDKREDLEDAIEFISTLQKGEIKRNLFLYLCKTGEKTKEGLIEAFSTAQKNETASDARKLILVVFSKFRKNYEDKNPKGYKYVITLFEQGKELLLTHASKGKSAAAPSSEIDDDISDTDTDSSALPAAPAPLAAPLPAPDDSWDRTMKNNESLV
jgi:hypothetical protein